MKNKEKYAKEIVDAVTSGGYGFGVNKFSGEIKRCNEVSCNECLFHYVLHGLDDCNKTKREWAESEYIGPMRISKRDRAFLDYLKDRWKYMGRDNISNAVYVFTEIPEKSEDGHFAYTGKARRISSDFNVVFPMVKWEDPEPWLIEDLKRLKVCEEYEID